MEYHLIDAVLFISFFLILTGLIHRFTNKRSLLPYTDALLIIGAALQVLFHVLKIPVHFKISPELIYFVLLPLLLFESAFHINYHQFRLQFKTITFLATFGLLASIFVIGSSLTILLGYPFEAAILFGAIISATDPIAVISLFKSLGAPKRLGLVADGESMLNDATGVIAFRLISGFVVAQTQFSTPAIAGGLGNFFYVFIGSIIFGGICGYVFSRIIETIENDRVLETTMTVAAALGSFTAAEHFFGLSGVISTVIAGIVVGNLGKTKFSPGVRESVEEFWAYFAFLSVSFVFFFATFNLDFRIFLHNPLNNLAAVAAVLLGRAVSVYGSIFISNRFSFFKNEPNIPLSWQHVLNWGGLRGVIPLVLVYSLPESYPYRNDMLSFTFSAFMFTLLINGLTIRSLLYKLGLHLPKKVEKIMNLEMAILDLEEANESVKNLNIREFDPAITSAMMTEIREEEQLLKKQLSDLANPAEMENSLKLQTLALERKALQDLFHKGVISENAYFDFETEIDLQQDALEYPEVYSGRGFQKGGKINTHLLFRNQMKFLKFIRLKIPFLKQTIIASKQNTVHDRLCLLKTRILTSEMTIDYLVKLGKAIEGQHSNISIIKKLISGQRTLIERNQNELQQISSDYRHLIEEYERKLAYSYAFEKVNSE